MAKLFAVMLLASSALYIIAEVEVQNVLLALAGLALVALCFTAATEERDG